MEPALDAMEKESQCESYFVPAVMCKERSPYFFFNGLQLDVGKFFLNFIKAFRIRAHMHLENGNVGDWFADIKTIYANFQAIPCGQRDKM